MREILFRGKRKDDGEWVEGYLFCTWSKAYILWGTTNGIPNMVEVNPKTVGQYTGLHDKNGKRIFEGDILKGERYPYCYEGEYNYFAEVVWFEDTPAFGLYTFKNPASKVSGISSGNCEYMEGFESVDWEVIGNIHDTPELLEEQHE